VLKFTEINFIQPVPKVLKGFLAMFRPKIRPKKSSGIETLAFASSQRYGQTAATQDIMLQNET